MMNLTKIEAFKMSFDKMMIILRDNLNLLNWQLPNCNGEPKQ